ncbi:asialoglycoprotein receptor 2-like [Mercenaria mercenaria]|uniref:asialoglycoprotein receptor 2-like n=1 Tax=Mercenaria mercenaria TaxID=6596 RepID=UPI00234F398A|nr:asialoglycoprotein receptor 2-like [Mercenaria mercenaria]
MTLLLLSALTSVVSLALCDYQCVCNHHTQRGIFGSPSLNSPPLGFLYKDECKAYVWQPNLDTQWVAVQFFHMIAYIQTDSAVDVIQCKGSVPDEDRASTMFPLTTIKPGQSSSITTSPPYTVTNPVSTGQYSSKAIQQQTFSSSTSTLSSQRTTILPTTSRLPPSTAAPITAQVTSKPVSKHHSTIKPSTAPVLTGHTELCPSNVQRGAHISGFLLGQYQHSCFEVCNQPVSWHHADSLCKGRGGHLASLNTHAQNSYLHTFLTNHFHDKSFWIGLNDIHQEEHFQWSSGEKVSFMNWEQHRKNQYHLREDCAVILKDGKWDDRDCGSNFAFTEFLHTRFPYVCEYGVTTGAPIIG